ncbi:MAG: asparagine synthase (glutamine-hydrolyzing), partial [Nitrospina sp.]|nr:asparagine synthase (glutamine-hydrolyzing) [Nitrospina sp.]
RGPDNAGLYREPGLALGNNRLSIVDLSGGNQPIFNEDRTLIIVYNGEIYNHIELRGDLEKKGHRFKTNSDTETVLHAFEEYGPQCLERFNGIFAFAVWNTREKSLFLARDSLGVKPLYLASLEGGLAFASEAKALLGLVPGGARPNWTALFQFFSYGYVPGPESPFEGIRKFPAGHFAWFRNNELEMDRYWKPELGMGNPVSIEEACEKVSGLLENSVEMELMGDVPVGVFLSGGLDSAAVAYYAQKCSKRNIQSFSLRFEESTHDESADARVVAEYLGLEHHELLFTKELLQKALDKTTDILDEPFGDSTVLPLLALSEFAREHVKVVLTGWGGDEIFAGYPTYRAHQLSSLYRKLPKFLSNTLIPSMVQRLPVSDKYFSLEFKAKRFIRGMDLSPELQHFIWMEYFGEPEIRKLFKREIIEQIKGDTLSPVRQTLGELSELDTVARIMHLDALFFLEGNGLFEVDRMTMAASLEARVPLLNIDLLNYVNSLETKVKMPGGRLKDLLRKILAPHLPERILNKPKKGFAPPSSIWLRGIFSQTFESIFTREKVESLGIFHYPEIQRMFQMHLARKADYGRHLWALLSFQLWYDRYIDGNPNH